MLDSTTNCFLITITQQRDLKQENDYYENRITISTNYVIILNKPEYT